MRREIAVLTFILPNLLIFTLFVTIPAVSIFFLSLTDYNTLSYEGRFVGLDNFFYLVKDREIFLDPFVKTLAFACLMIPSVFFLSLALAVVTSSDLIWGKRLLSLLFYWPWILSPVIIGISWRWFLDYDAGVVNIILWKLGIEPVPWLLDRNLAFISVILASVWNVSGYFMVMFNAALTSIPKEIYEAAQLDGAGRWTRFWKITFPLLKPTATLVLVLTTILAIRSFEVIYVLTAGGPGTATTLIVQRIFETAFEERKLGLASAISVILFAVLMTLSLIQIKILGESENAKA